MEDQMRVTYANAAKILARFGATLDHVAEETLYVLDVDAEFDVAGKVRKEAYSTDRPQCARNLLGVTRLAFPAQHNATISHDTLVWEACVCNCSTGRYPDKQ